MESYIIQILSLFILDDILIAMMIVMIFQLLQPRPINITFKELDQSKKNIITLTIFFLILMLYNMMDAKIKFLNAQLNIALYNLFHPQLRLLNFKLQHITI